MAHVGPLRGTLASPRDVAVGAASVYIVDTCDSEPGRIHELSGEGSLRLLSTSEAIADPIGVAVDPTSQHLLLADAGASRLVRVAPQTGDVRNVVTGLQLVPRSAACVDITPDGTQLFVTGQDAIFTFTR